MKNRIKILINREKKTAAQFANEIGIAPSSLHHIVSGRNNPSLEILQKILKRFPELNAEWLINGKGNPFKDLVQGELFDIPNPYSKEERNFNKDLIITESPSNKKPETINQKTVDKVIIFYTDQTFEIFKHL